MKKTKETDKKKKLPFRRNISNTLFALKSIWSVSKAYFIFYFLITLLYAPLDFLQGSYLMRVIVNGLEKGTPASVIFTYIGIVGGATVLINAANSFYWNVVSPGMYEKINNSIQKKLFKKAAEVELACYETPEFYNKYVKAMDEAKNRIMRVMNTLDNLIWRVVSLLCNSFLLFYIDPLLIVFGLFPLILGFVRRYDNKLNHDLNTELKIVDRRNNYVRRTFYLGEYAKEMRIGNMYVKMLAEYRDTFREYKRLMRKYGLRRALCSFLSNFGLEAVTILGAMLYAVWCTIVRNTMSIGDCIVILNSIGTISYCLNNMVQNFAEFGEHSLFLEDVRFFLDYKPKMAENADGKEAHGGDIVLENVSFKYEGSDNEVLHNISLHIKAGEKIALVGQNGSGKSTLVKLLLRLYDPTDGKILLGDTDIKDYRLSSYRDGFSCVFQDFKVFSLPVKDNVLLKRSSDGDDEAVIQALTESGVYDKIATLDKGINTTLTREFDENGANLSVGEQQKISLARVFVSDSPCVILDEPSSALDPIAEHTMFENMMRASKGRSVIFISHRLSSAVDSDRIYLLDKGEIKESGTHHELMQKNGKYAEMFRLQAESYLGKEENA